MEKQTREELEEFIRDRSHPGLESLMLAAMEDLPERVNDLRMLRAGVEGLRGVLEPCECGRPDCLAAPRHREKWEGQYREALEKAEAAAEAMIQAIVEAEWIVSNCDCYACRTKEQRQNASLN